MWEEGPDTQAARWHSSTPNTLLPPPSKNAAAYIAFVVASGATMTLDDELERALLAGDREHDTIPSPPPVMGVDVARFPDEYIDSIESTD